MTTSTSVSKPSSRSSQADTSSFSGIVKSVKSIGLGKAVILGACALALPFAFKKWGLPLINSYRSSAAI